QRCPGGRPAALLAGADSDCVRAAGRTAALSGARPRRLTGPPAGGGRGGRRGGDARRGLERGGGAAAGALRFVRAGGGAAAAARAGRAGGAGTLADAVDRIRGRFGDRAIVSGRMFAGRATSPAGNGGARSPAAISERQGSHPEETTHDCSTGR